MLDLPFDILCLFIQLIKLPHSFFLIQINVKQIDYVTLTVKYFVCDDNYLFLLASKGLLDRNYQSFIFTSYYNFGMDKFGLGFLASQDDAKAQAVNATTYMNANGQFEKKNGSEFLDAILKQLDSSETTPISKVMTLHVLKQLTYQLDVKFFSLFMTHKLLEFLVRDAKQTDPKKSIQQKGLKKFPGSPELGRQYMRLELQLLNFWGEKFGKSGSSDEPTKFKRNLTDLKNSGVVLPSNYQFFDLNLVKSKKKNKGQSPAEPQSKMKQTTPKSNVMNQLTSQVPEGKMNRQMNYTKEKIGIFIASLEEFEEDQNQAGDFIQQNHIYFQKQKDKYNAKQTQIIQDQSLQLVYFGLIHFFEEQNKSFNQYIPKTDIRSYVTKMKLIYEEVFPEEQPVVEKQKKKVQSKPPSRMEYSDTKKFNASSRGEQKKLEQKIQTKQIITNIMTKFTQRSKSPLSGFKAVQNELQKEKQIAKRNPQRKASKSPRNIHRSDAGLHKSTASNLRQSKVHPIFTTPPNQDVGYRNYQGDVILENRDLNRSVYNIKRDQGTRRFKISNFRQKNPLFQNDHIQIGYKSQAVYESIGEFSHFIMLNIFIGNKTEEGIKQFQVEYKADSNQLLYANPRNVDSIIPAGYQNKHDLMITPLFVPFSLMTMNISYKFNNTGYMTSIVLPNSVVKFASYMKIEKQDFLASWKSSKKYRTNPFRLCKNLPPDSFNKWITVLQNITRYQDFSREGSQTDLQMFCNVIMLQKYQAVLKINIRPNLDVILQLGVMDHNDEAISYFKFYLQTMQLLLKDIDI